MHDSLPLASLHLVHIAALAVVGAVVAFRLLERRGRERWSGVARGSLGAPSGPYRSSSLVASRHARAPFLVRVTSFTGLAFGHLFVPVLILALLTFPFDGIAVPLMPGVAVALAYWACAWAMLGRLNEAAALSRAVAVASMVANMGLLALCPIHLLLIENHRLQGLRQAVSTSVTGVELLFAAAAVVQASLMLATLRLHRGALESG